MKKEMYVTPETEVEELDKDVFTEDILLISGTSTQDGGITTDIEKTGDSIGW